MNRKFWKDKKVFITGHTGFKGSWLSFWLNECGSKVKGYSLEPSTNPNLYDVLDLNSIMDSNFGDIRHLDLLEKSISEFKPASLSSSLMESSEFSTELCRNLNIGPVISLGITERMI